MLYLFDFEIRKHMKLYSIETGNFKLDGGAMFGVVPKSIWNKMYPADENNMIKIALRSLLVVDGDRKILIDSGLGDKHGEKFLSHYYLDNNTSLEKSLSAVGYSTDDITDNILSHLHFDHCGGSVKYNEDKTKLVPTFKNATYWVSRKQWNSALNPNRREVASYFNDNYVPLKEHGQLQLIDEDSKLFPNLYVKIYSGHTEGQIIPFIKTEESGQDKSTVVFMADLIPFTTHLHLPFIMSYDISPILSLKENETFLEEAVAGNYILFFQHDIYNECCTVHKTEKGYRAKEIFKLSDKFN